MGEHSVRIKAGCLYFATIEGRFASFAVERALGGDGVLEVLPAHEHLG